MRYFIGIDPGLSGAISLIDETGKALAVLDMPLMVKGKGSGKVKNCVDPRGLQDLLRGYMVMVLPNKRDEYNEFTCVLETVNSMPGQGVAGVFSLGDTYGAIRATITCLGIPLCSVSPVTWKKHFKIPKEKEVARALAIEMFPEIADRLTRKKDIDRAESLLLALYGLQQER